MSEPEIPEELWGKTTPRGTLDCDCEMGSLLAYPTREEAERPEVGHRHGDAVLIGVHPKWREQCRAWREEAAYQRDLFHDARAEASRVPGWRRERDTAFALLGIAVGVAASSVAVVVACAWL